MLDLAHPWSLFLYGSLGSLGSIFIQVLSSEMFLLVSAEIHIENLELLRKQPFWTTHDLIITFFLLQSSSFLPLLGWGDKEGERYVSGHIVCSSNQMCISACLHLTVVQLDCRLWWKEKVGVKMAFSAGTAEVIWKTCIPVFKQYRLNPPLHKPDSCVSAPVGTALG